MTATGRLLSSYETAGVLHNSEPSRKGQSKEERGQKEVWKGRGGGKVAGKEKMSVQTAMKKHWLGPEKRQ